MKPGPLLLVLAVLGGCEAIRPIPEKVRRGNEEEVPRRKDPDHTRARSFLPHWEGRRAGVVVACKRRAPGRSPYTYMFILNIGDAQTLRSTGIASSRT